MKDVYHIHKTKEDFEDAVKEHPEESHAVFSTGEEKNYVDGETVIMMVNDVAGNTVSVTNQMIQDLTDIMNKCAEISDTIPEDNNRTDGIYAILNCCDDLMHIIERYVNWVKEQRPKYEKGQADGLLSERDT